MGLLSFIEEMKPYVDKLTSLSFKEIKRILSIYGIRAIQEVVGLPEDGEGVMTKRLYFDRKLICSGCLLKTPANTCSPSIERAHKTELDPATGGPKMVKGCGCGLWAKQGSFQDHCPAGEW